MVNYDSEFYSDSSLVALKTKLLRDIDKLSAKPNPNTRWPGAKRIKLVLSNRLVWSTKDYSTEDKQVMIAWWLVTIARHWCELSCSCPCTIPSLVSKAADSWKYNGLLLVSCYCPPIACTESLKQNNRILSKRTRAPPKFSELKSNQIESHWNKFEPRSH